MQLHCSSTHKANTFLLALHCLALIQALLILLCIWSGFYLVPIRTQQPLKVLCEEENRSVPNCCNLLHSPECQTDLQALGNSSTQVTASLNPPKTPLALQTETKKPEVSRKNHEAATTRPCSLNQQQEQVSYGCACMWDLCEERGEKPMRSPVM